MSKMCKCNKLSVFYSLKECKDFYLCIKIKDMDKSGRFMPKKQKISTIPVSEESLLMDFLIVKLQDQSRNKIKSLLAHQQVLVNRRVIRQFDHLIKPGDDVSILWTKGKQSLNHPRLKILFEDKDLIVVEKAAGLLSIGTAKERSKTAYSILSEYVKKQHPGNKIFVVHRLDRETSGIMLFAKNQDIQSLMQNNWRFAVNQRKYLGVLEGIPQTGDGSGQGTVISYLWESKALIVYASSNPEDGLKAITHYKVLKSSEHYSIAEFRLDTGRKNQIRVQMNSIGYPIAGDLKYGGHPSPIKRMALHACVLAFTHPVSGEQMLFESEIPKEFNRLLALDSKNTDQ